MKKSLLIFLVLCLSCIANAAQKRSQVAKNSKLSTNVVFGDGVYHGKYQTAMESVSTVENEKILNSLLGVRRDFRDRLNEEKMRK